MIKQCKYYSAEVWQGDGCCKAGVNARQLVGEGAGWLRRLPCTNRFKSDIVCEKIEFPTDQEIEEAHKKYEERFAAVNKVIEIIKTQPSVEAFFHGVVSDREDFTGKITCPLCQGTLSYTVSAFNDHIRGQCETEDCLSWMM